MKFFLNHSGVSFVFIALLFLPIVVGAVTANYYHSTEIGYTSRDPGGGAYDPLFPATRSEPIAVHPANSNIIYRGGWGSGVVKSTDGGRTWEYKNNGLPSLYVDNIEFDPFNPAIMYVGLSGHIWANGAIVYKSTNSGDYWEPIPGLLNYDPGGNIVNPCGTWGAIAVDPADSRRLYVGASVNECNVRGLSCGGTYRSADGGITFGINPGCSPLRPPDRTKYWPDNDTLAIRIDPESTNVVYMLPTHTEGVTMGTSFDYADTIHYADVVDTRGSSLPAGEQYVMNLRIDKLELAPSNSEIRYGRHGGANVKRRSDDILDPYGTFGSGSPPWTIPVEQILVRYDGAKSQSAIDGVNDNDADGDPGRDNIWKPIFSPSISGSLPALGAPSSFYPTVYQFNDFIVDSVDPNKVYAATFGSYKNLSNPNYTINIWELTPNPANPGGMWNFRSIYESKPAYPNVKRIWSMKSDPQDPHRIYFTQKSVGYLDGSLYPNTLTDFKLLESTDNGATWSSQTLSSSYTYFHATDIREFRVANSTTRIFLGSTQRMYVNSGSGWTPRSFTAVSPQGNTFLGFSQSPLDPDVIFVKGPRFVARSSNGGDYFGQFDEIAFGLGEYYPNAAPPDSCLGPIAFTDPALTTTVFNALAAHPAEMGTIYAGADNGVWRNRHANPSGNYCYGPDSIMGSSRAWEKISTTGLENTYIWSLKFDPGDPAGNTLWAGTRSGLYKSVDGGTSWQTAISEIRDVKQIRFSGTTILAASLDGLYRSGDSGNSWQRVLASQANYLSLRMGFLGQWITATDQGLERSQDDGRTWAVFPAAFSGPVDAALYTSTPIGSERVYYTGKGDALYRTDRAVCGNGILESGEACDGSNFGDPPASCISRGYTGGTVSCNPITCALDVSACVNDTTPPVRSNSQPAGILPAGTEQVTLGVDTDKPATCKYGTSPSMAYANLPKTFTTTGGQTHRATVSVQDSQNTYYVRCADVRGNQNTDDFSISFFSGTPDTAPPIISNGQPTGILLAGTVETSIGVTTNEDATCRYSRIQGAQYENMTEEFFTTGGQDHSSEIMALRNGTTYNFYVRCEDRSLNLNKNTADYSFSFSVGGKSSQTCGNGIIEGTEQCDGINLNGVTCGLLGQGNGTIACDPLRCRYNTSGCSGPGEVSPQTLTASFSVSDSGDNGLFEIGSDLRVIPDSGGLCPTGMVWVPAPGGFCIDKYENNLIGVNRMAAESACSEKGRRLPSNTEWWLASAGTPDGNISGPCNVGGAGPITPGISPNCRAFSGAYDMIGNYAEWTEGTRNTALADGYIASLSSDGFPLSRQIIRTATTEKFANDYIWVSAASGGVLRGGTWNDLEKAGRNTAEVTVPSATQSQGRTAQSVPIGFRCVAE